MATAKKGAGAPRKKRSDAKGYKLVGLRLTPEQDAALLRAARAEAQKTGRALADKSAIARQAIDAWLKGR
ncbi:hypothetical protein [Anaeromyxobacter dehalogenans]|nr:hypothetical protein [Anaeromyxobacter dehalogenans]